MLISRMVLSLLGGGPALLPRLLAPVRPQVPHVHACQPICGNSGGVGGSVAEARRHLSQHRNPSSAASKSSNAELVTNVLVAVDPGRPRNQAPGRRP
jgi:hypothetical protein